MHALVQATGYIKYKADPWERIFFRGQNKIHESLRPSLYRGIQTENVQGSRHAWINQIVKQLSDSEGVFHNIPEYAHEPLLQHYGLKTTWLDLVDNIWVALWFAVNRSFSVGKYNEFLHFEERTPLFPEEYGYILLIRVDENKRAAPRKGMIVGKDTETIDLRVAVPSIFLRPHAQHGLLFRRRGNDSTRALDYISTVEGIIRFDLKKGLDWLGRGSMHSVRSLFPPPHFDHGYRILLNHDLSDKKHGCIHHICA